MGVSHDAGPVADRDGAADSAPSGDAASPSAEAGNGVDGDGLGDGQAPASGTVTLAMTSFTVEPGDEVYQCQQVGRPFGGDVQLVSMEGAATPGVRKFFLFDMDAESARTETSQRAACPGGGLEFHPVAFMSEAPHLVKTFPANMGYPLNADHGLMLDAHVINTSAQRVVVNVSVTVQAVPRSGAQVQVGTLYLVNSQFSVPPLTSQGLPLSITRSTAPFAKDVQLLTSTSYMELRSLDFIASIGGKVFYEEPSWNAPALFEHQPYVALPAATPLSWTCRYYNDTTRVLTFGDSAINNVSCDYLGWYFPADPSSPGVVSVLQ